LPFVERVNEDSQVEETTEELKLSGVEVTKPVNTLEGLIDNMVMLTPTFYNEGNEYLLEPQRKDRINKKLKTAQDARTQYETILKVKDTPKKREAWLALNNANKDVREEIHEISHYTANKILELNKKQDIPVVSAGEPEENMLDFSMILGQLETKAMYLKPGGLVNLKSLTTQAINRGKNNRSHIEDMKNFIQPRSNIPLALTGGGANETN
jgi:hypothetical protein